MTRSSQREAARRREWTLALDVYKVALAAQREATSRVPIPPDTPQKWTASNFQQDSRTSEASTIIAMKAEHKAAVVARGGGGGDDGAGGGAREAVAARRWLRIRRQRKGGAQDFTYLVKSIFRPRSF